MGSKLKYIIDFELISVISSGQLKLRSCLIGMLSVSLSLAKSSIENLLREEELREVLLVLAYNPDRGDPLVYFVPTTPLAPMFMGTFTLNPADDAIDISPAALVEG